MTKMTRRLLGLTLLAFLIVAIGWTASPPQPLNVKVQILSGTVRLLRSGSAVSEVVTDIFPVMAGDVIETLTDTRAVVVYSDGTFMRLKPKTKVQIEANSLKVFKGQAWCKFVKRGTEFVIETPSLIAGIRGTAFEVTVTPRMKTMLSVTEGAVAVRSPSQPAGSETLVQSGQGTQCDYGKLPQAPIKIDANKKMAEWPAGDWGKGSIDLDELFNQADRHRQGR